MNDRPMVIHRLLRRFAGVDLFDTAQSKRLFGFIAAGGTAGALCGPTLTSLVVYFEQLRIVEVTFRSKSVDPW